LISRAELKAGVLASGEMNGRAFAAFLGVPHGTIKRWLYEGMPARRETGNSHKRVWITPDAGKAWVQAHYPRSISVNRKAVVYVARRFSDNAVKVGFTSDVVRRMSEVGKETGESVVLLACWPGDKPEELRIHALLAKASLGLEWFAPTSEVEAFVESLGSIAGKSATRRAA
jgi:hypothetical protein